MSQLRRALVIVIRRIVTCRLAPFRGPLLFFRQRHLSWSDLTARSIAFRRLHSTTLCTTLRDINDDSSILTRWLGITFRLMHSTTTLSRNLHTYTHSRWTVSLNGITPITCYRCSANDIDCIVNTVSTHAFLLSVYLAKPGSWDKINCAVKKLKNFLITFKPLIRFTLSYLPLFF